MLRKMIVMLVLVLSLVLSGCQKEVVLQDGTNVEEQKRFDNFVTGEIKSYLEDSYLTIHQTVNKPEVYGVSMDDVTIELTTPWQENQFDEVNAELENVQKEFDSFVKSDLTLKQQNTYEIIKDQIEIAQLSNKPEFEYAGNMFGSFNGLHLAVPQILTDFVFYTEKDVDDFVTLMNSVKPIFDSYIEYAKKQKEVGMFISNKNVDDVVAYSKKVVDEGFGLEMLEIIIENIKNFDKLNDTQIANYTKQVTQAYYDSIVPAYTNLATELVKYKSDENNQLGLAHLENGKQLYELFYRIYTGSTLSVEEAEKMLLAKITKGYTEIQKAVMKDQSVLQKLVDEDLPTGYSNYEDMIDGLIDWSKDHYKGIDFPEFEAVPATKLVSDGVGAYYVVPFIDKQEKNLIRVNTNNQSLVDSLNTYYYIAHEGVPGHMYYYNYLVQNEMDDYNILVATYLGFSEGFANYSASLAIDGAMGSDELKTLVRANFDINWALSALIDIGIHYHGWTVDELALFLKDYGLEEVAQELFDSTQSNPGVNLSYGVGYFEILDLKAKAEKKLGSKFDEIKFNEVLLKSGNAPFRLVEENVNQYIKEMK